MKKILILLLVSYVCCQGSVTFEIYPGQNYQENTPSPRACFANCQFCQISTGICQDCFFPFFRKNQNGSCILISNDYVLESENNQLQRGQGFLLSNGWSNRTRRACNNNPNFDLTVLGLFRNTTLQYTRTIGQHKYFAIKFFFLKSNWTNEDRINIQIRNQNSQLLVQNNITGNNKIPTQSLCSNQSVDQRFSVKYLFEERQVSQIRIIFTPSMRSDNGSWGIGNFAFISGGCDPLCQQCNFSPLPNQCKPNSCKNFHNYTSDGSCSNCANGFRKLLNNTCQKCPIEQQRCQQNDTVCFYRNRTKLQLNNTTCQLIQPGNYKDQKYVNDISFSGSLFNVNGRAATTTCGPYTFVGLAQPGQTITRIFATTIRHIGISVSFNIFIQDQRDSFDVQPFVILIDGTVVQTLAITLQGTSNVCGNYSLKQVFTTYYPTSFYPHTRFSNVNISISSEASNWGIRDLRVMFQKCDESCLNCSQNDGCITCAGSLQLSNLSCSACISGFTIVKINQNAELSCKKCVDQNCQMCLTPNNCSLCYQGYFIFKNICEINPQTGQTFNPNVWSGNFLNTSCVISNEQNQTVSFEVVQDKLSGNFTINDPLLDTLVQFRLIKIDDWTQEQYLQLYINDLRLMYRNFNQTGQKICEIADQNQQISFESFKIRDNNSTIAIQFSVVKSPNVKKKFGIADFKIIPFGCRDCAGFGFQYKVLYNIDKYINIQVAFNRIYQNDNFTQFKEIFKLMHANKEIQYEVIQTDYVRYMLRAPLLFIIDQKLTLICLYPEKVVTNVYDKINQLQFFSTNRMMQVQNRNPGGSKYLDNNQSSVNVIRSVPLGQSQSAAEGLRIFFEVLSRIVIYVGFGSFLIGCQTPFTHLMHNFQKLWVHIWVASLAIPPLLKTTLIGFRETQNQNIAINPSGWQDPLPDQLYYQAPAYYQQYYHDISFLRNIYNIGFAFALLLFFFILFKILLSIFDLSERWGQYKIIRHLIITYKKTNFFYINSILFYQYFTLVLACYLQFIDLTNNTNQPAFTGVNAAAAIVAYVIATAWPIISFLYLKYRQNSLYESGNEIVYRNKYHEIFFRFLQPKTWQIGADEDYINKKQELYNTFRYGQLWWIGIIVCLMYNSPFAQAFLLIVTNFIHILLILFTPLQFTIWFGFLKVVQLGFFIGLQILILVSYSLIDTSSQDSYETYGKVGVAFIFVIVVLSFIRTFYTLHKIIREYAVVNSQHYHDIKIDQRRRNLLYYDVPIDNEQ